MLHAEGTRRETNPSTETALVQELLGAVVNYLSKERLASLLVHTFYVALTLGLTSAAPKISDM